MYKGSIQIKKCHKKGKKYKRGEGSAPKIKKSTIQNVDFLIRGGGGQIFRFSPNVSVDFKFSVEKNQVSYKVIFRQFKVF